MPQSWSAAFWLETASGVRLEEQPGPPTVRDENASLVDTDYRGELTLKVMVKHPRASESFTFLRVWIKIDDGRIYDRTVNIPKRDLAPDDQGNLTYSIRDFLVRLSQSRFAHARLGFTPLLYPNPDAHPLSWPYIYNLGRILVHVHFLQGEPLSYPVREDVEEVTRQPRKDARVSKQRSLTHTTE